MLKFLTLLMTRVSPCRPCWLAPMFHEMLDKPFEEKAYANQLAEFAYRGEDVVKGSALPRLIPKKWKILPEIQKHMMS